VEQEKVGLREELLQVEREKLDVETERSGECEVPNKREE